MTAKCPEHNIDLTESGDCSECSKAKAAPEPDADVQNDYQASKDDDLNAAHEKNDSEPKSQKEFFLTESKTDANEVLGPITAGMIDTLVQFIQPKESSDTKNDEGKRTVSLFENSETTQLKNAGDLDFELIEIFKRERILLLGGLGDEHSDLVSHQIARLLKITDKENNIRRLDLSYYASSPLTIQTVSPERKAADNKVVHDALVFVDAINESGRDFTGSLLKSTAGFIHQYSSKLLTNKLYMICLVDADSIDEYKKNGKKINSLYWIIPNKKDETPSSENDPEIKRKVETLLNSNSETDALIVRIILFIVSFFPDLTTNDFNDLVNKWLKNEPEIIIENPVKNNSENAILTKISLSEIWKAKSRFFTEQCFLLQKRDNQGKRVINFYNESYAKFIKKQLEDSYWAFVDEKVSEILQMRLIFHPSDNIASQSAAILAEYLPGNEENFIDWLLWVFNVLNDEENRAENLRRILGIHDLDGDVEETGKKYFYYKRLAKLFEAVLRHSSLKKTVSNIMTRLIEDGCFQSALILVKNLQYDPNFEEFYWLRQLLERGDDKTKREIKKYLFNNLINTDINDAFNKLKEWLPQENSPSGNYSQMNKAALELLIRYYSYQINVFDETLYGLEPTRFSFFLFESKASANEQLNLLAKYLLHPLNLKLKLEGMPYIYYAALLLERWSRILCKNNLSTRTTASAGERIGNQEILSLLLEKVVMLSGEEEQEQIKSVWQGLIDIHEAIQEHNSDWEIREQAVRESEFLTNLIELFNDRQWVAN
jgi:hypothetical protein